MCLNGDGISWMAGQLGSRAEPPKSRAHNPRPPGVIRPGSGTDVLLRFLRASPHRSFYHSELVLALGRSKGEVDWALVYLKESRLIVAVEVELPGRKPVKRYQISDQK